MIKFRVKVQLALQDMNQKQLASKINAIPQTITDWKTGKTTSYTDYMASLSDVLGVSIDYLMTGEKETPIVQDDGLTEKERDLIERFRKLPPDRQQYVWRCTADQRCR